VSQRYSNKLNWLSETRSFEVCGCCAASASSTVSRRSATIAVATDGFYLGSLYLTLQVALIVVAWSLLIGYPVAYVLTRMPSRRATLIIAAIVASALVAKVIKVLGLIVIFSADGIVNRALIALGAASTPIKILGSITGVAERAALKAQQPKLDAPRLVFIDGVTTKMVWQPGRSPCGKRLVVSVPHDHWKSLTLVAALRIDRMTNVHVRPPENPRKVRQSVQIDTTAKTLENLRKSMYYANIIDRLTGQQWKRISFSLCGRASHALGKRPLFALRPRASTVDDRRPAGGERLTAKALGAKSAA
jgi:hypothetical protein